MNSNDLSPDWSKSRVFPVTCDHFLSYHTVVAALDLASVLSAFDFISHTMAFTISMIHGLTCHTTPY